MSHSVSPQLPWSRGSNQSMAKKSHKVSTISIRMVSTNTNSNLTLHTKCESLPSEGIGIFEAIPIPSPTSCILSMHHDGLFFGSDCDRLVKLPLTWLLTDSSVKEKPILVRGVLVATPHRVEQHAASRRTVLMMVMVMVRILVAASH